MLNEFSPKWAAVAPSDPLSTSRRVGTHVSSTTPGCLLRSKCYCSSRQRLLPRQVHRLGRPPCSFFGGVSRARLNLPRRLFQAEAGGGKSGKRQALAGPPGQAPSAPALPGADAGVSQPARVRHPAVTIETPEGGPPPLALSLATAPWP